MRDEQTEPCPICGHANPKPDLHGTQWRRCNDCGREGCDDCVYEAEAYPYACYNCAKDVESALLDPGPGQPMSDDLDDGFPGAAGGHHIPRFTRNRNPESLAHIRAMSCIFDAVIERRPFSYLHQPIDHGVFYRSPVAKENG